MSRHRTLAKSIKYSLVFIWKVFFAILKLVINGLRQIPKIIVKFPEYVVLAKKVGQKFIRDDCISFSSQLAFNIVLALFPSILVIVIALSFIQSDKTIDILSELIGAVLPQEVYSPIQMAFESASKSADSFKRGDLLVFSLVFSFLSATSIFITVMKAMRSIYKIEEKQKPIQKYRVAFELVLIVGLALLILFNILIMGYRIELFLYNFFKWKGIIVFFGIFKYPIVLFVITVTTTLIYKLSLRIGQRFEHVLPGAITVAVLWIPLSIWFGDFMKSHIYGTVYKTLAKLITIPLWAYANAMIFFIGAELNSILYKPGVVRKKQKLSTRAKRFLEAYQQ